MTEQGSYCLSRLRDHIHAGFAYFSVLRPSFIFGAIIVYLPLTALGDWMPGNSMLANLFVEYGFWKAFWFGFALLGAVWALMLTTCLSLDLARDRQHLTQDNWLPDPGPGYRSVTISMPRVKTFLLFSLAALPGAGIVIWQAETWGAAIAGFVLGALVPFLSMNQVAAIIYADNQQCPVLPWKPVGLKVRWFGGWFRRTVSGAMRFMQAPAEIFDWPSGILKDDHFFATLSTAAVVLVYTSIYWFFKPSGIGFPLQNIPPAAFIYALLLPLIWIVTALWVYLSRYRLAILAAVLATALVTRLATIHWIEAAIGGPSHTYDVVPKQTPPSSLANPPAQKLIVVAASGGGILAAGWTAHVLTQLHMAHGDFPRQLGLISAVSGGSVGAAHYLSGLDAIGNLRDAAKRKAALTAIANDAMRSSLASTSYGVAFADFRRIVFPFFADEAFDRGRLIEADWRRLANCRKAALARGIDESKFQDFCRQQNTDLIEAKTWISQMLARTNASAPVKPTLIFNSTVMETGERIAITSLASLQSPWHGGSDNPPRHAHARTLSEFLSAAKATTAPDPSKQDSGAQKLGSCDPARFRQGYDIDLWSAARLSATFSYVSPAARAACLDPVANEREAAASDSLGRLHLIDGGYHDNFGVASALDWIVSHQSSDGGLPFERIALIEIRAKPDIPSAREQNEWSSAWLGPFWGLFNSWGFAQTSANDTAVNQLIARFKDDLRKRKVCIDSFVFVPKWAGPLSWHLSEEQKAILRQQWDEGTNPAVLENLKKFLAASHGDDADCKLR